ncbi:MAG: hypothetical protein ACRDSF_12330 [Pseudonocardiaceae bacterium]
MANHHRTTPLLRLLGRLGWQRDPHLWTVHCRDGHGCRARILVHLSAAGVCLTVPDHGPLQLSVLQAGQLRAALRYAFLSLERLAGPDGLSAMIESQRTTSATPPPVRSPSSRERVPVRIPARPSVAELRLRQR